MCQRSLGESGPQEEGNGSSLLSFVSTSDTWIEKVKLVGYGVDTPVLNVRYADQQFQPIQQELDTTLMQELDYLQGEA